MRVKDVFHMFQALEKILTFPSLHCYAFYFMPLPQNSLLLFNI